MTEPLSNFLEILPGIVEIFGAVLIWGLTCITVALAPDCRPEEPFPCGLWLREKKICLAKIMTGNGVMCS